MEFIDQLDGLVSSRWQALKGILSIFKLEARLAKLSIVPLVINLLVLFILLGSTWLSALLLIGYGLAVYFNSFFVSAIGVFALNAGLLLLIVRFSLTNLRRMSFEKTRECLSTQPRSNQNELKKTVD